MDDGVLQHTIGEMLPRILRWAIGKTHSRAEGEELTQQVFAQYMKAVRDAAQVERPEHLLWKVARYTWCNHLRSGQNRGRLRELQESLPDESDFAEAFAEDEARAGQLTALRAQISRLSHLQREAMISHYLDGLTVAQTAHKLGVPESALTWHLYDARKRVKREMERMDERTQYVYRPGRLAVGCSGDPGPEPDTKQINASLIRQNLCLLCYRAPRSLEELADQTGIPKPYLEFDLDWLVAREFLTLEGKRYSTAFPIIGKRHMQDIGTLFARTRPQLIDAVIDALWQSENDIRALGFYGAQRPGERMMWAILTLFISYASRNSPLLLRLKDRSDRPMRPDGGRYIVMASDKSEGQALDPGGYQGEILWGGYCGIMSECFAPGDGIDRYYWLGVNRFSARAFHPDIAYADEAGRIVMHAAYVAATKPAFSPDSLDAPGKEALARAVACGLIDRQGDVYEPRYTVFTREQLTNLRQRVFAPLLTRLEPVFEQLGARIAAMHRADFPRIHQLYVNYHTYVDLWDFGIYALMYAAQAGKLAMPEQPERCTALTLALVE